jgi:thymidylate synthase
MFSYLKIIEKIFAEGAEKQNRTGIKTIAIPGAMFEHSMCDGFPLLTTKKVPFKLVSSELEFFIKGITDKKWLQDRDNHIWDEWCSPKIVKYGTDEQSKELMKAERDLGPIYGWQWRHFGDQYASFDKESFGGIDQLKNLVYKLKNNPEDRRMIVSAWNPLDIEKMALPPCHYCFQVTVINNQLNLLWNQRSVDVALGLPFNIASYGLLLHLLAKESGLAEGKLIGFLVDTHIYDNHIEGLRLQLKRLPWALPKIETNNFKSIFEWQYNDSVLEKYNHHPGIKFEIAV